MDSSSSKLQCKPHSNSDSLDWDSWDCDWTSLDLGLGNWT